MKILKKPENYSKNKDVRERKKFKGQKFKKIFVKKIQNQKRK